MADFSIYGAIIDNESQRESFEDLTPNQFKSFISKLDEGEELVIHMNSPGGSVTSGISIANMVLTMTDHPTKCIVEGLCGSIATVIMCACTTVSMSDSSFVMIHNPYSVIAEGSFRELRQEADTLEKMRDVILSFYHRKFNATDEQLSRWMDDETWFCGSEAQDYGFECDVSTGTESVRYAASVKRFTFNRIPKRIKDTMSEEEKNETVEETVEKKDNPEEVVEVPEMVPVEEVEKRVSGMQSKLGKQIDALKKEKLDLTAKHEFEMTAKNEELNSMRTKFIDLESRLSATENELSKMTSAFEEQERRLMNLNASVLTPNETLPSFENGLSRCRTLKERIEYIDSGRYTN